MNWKDLKIGKKLTVGFGIVGILFIIVVFQYQRTLSDTINGFCEVLSYNEQMKSLISDIGRQMLQSSRSEKNYLLRLDMKYPPLFETSIA